MSNMYIAPIIAYVTLTVQPYADTICGPPSKLLCQLVLTCIISPVSLNAVCISVSEYIKLTVGTGQLSVGQTTGA